MALAMKEQGQDANGGPWDENMSLTDYAQVAMQTGVSMLHLNDIQAKYRFVEQWRRKLVNRLLEKDFDAFRGFQAGRQALREWH